MIYKSVSVVPAPAPDADDSFPTEKGANKWLCKPLRLSLNPALLNKNESGETRLYAEGWVNATPTPSELADAIDAGFAYSCELRGPRKAGNFLASDVLSVDIDGGRRIEEILEDPLASGHLTILYPTPSHTEEEHRFRLIFALPRTIEDPAEMRAAARSLALRLNGDLVATDPARLYFGSRGSRPRVWDRGLTDAMLDELVRQGLDADSGMGDGREPDTTTSRLSLHPDRPVRTASGSTSRVEDLPGGTPVCCPYHNDTHPSAFVVVSATRGSKGIHCSTCAQTFWPAGTAFAHDFSDFDRTVEGAQLEFDRHRDWGPLAPYLGPQENFVRKGLEQASISFRDERHLRLDRIEKGITFIKSPKGTGKTECLKGALADRSPNDDASSVLVDGEAAGRSDRPAPLKGSVLLIGHRIALIRHSCERLGLECYLDREGKLTNQKQLGITWDSLHRLMGRGTMDHRGDPRRRGGKGRRDALAKFDTIILDESEQVLAHCLSDTIPCETRTRNFAIFRALLRRARRVIALDADLGFASFATLNRLVNEEMPVWAATRSHVIINRYKRGGRIQLFEDRDHLVADLHQALRDGRRVFVVSNARGRIDALAEGITVAFGNSIRQIKITSDTNTSEDVVRFISSPRVEALCYDVILASPTIGTGVDVSFEDDAPLIDTVYGFFMDSVTTHFDMDQQLGRVRHPGEVKVWVSPRRFRYDTSIDVVRSDIHRQNLFKSVLLRFEDGRPVYDMNDPLIEMAALILSRERASKNNLRHYFIEHKERQGFVVEVVEKDAHLSGEGEIVDRLGREMSIQKRTEILMAAEPLGYGAFRALEQRIRRNEEVTQAERCARARTKLELFYRARIAPEMITLDAEGRHRERVCLFEQILRTLESSEWSELRQRLSDAPANWGITARLQRDRTKAAELLLQLLGLTPVLNGGRFDPEVLVTSDDLQVFAKEILSLKPVVENLLGIEVRRDVGTKPMTQLNAVLRTTGLCCRNAGKTRARAVAGGRAIRHYRLDRDVLERMTALAQLRSRQEAWRTLYEIHNWDCSELEESIEEE